MASALDGLTPKQRIFVESVLSGMSKVAAATAAGYGVPAAKAKVLPKVPAVAAAIEAAQKVTARKVDFDRQRAHELYMEAYRNAETASEQIQAVNAMVKLHGIAEPEQVKHQHTHTHGGEVGMKALPNDELLKLAGLNDDPFVIEGELATPDPVLLEGPDNAGERG